MSCGEYQQARPSLETVNPTPVRCGYLKGHSIFLSMWDPFTQRCVLVMFAYLLLRKISCIPSLSQTCHVKSRMTLTSISNPPASNSWVLGFQACTTLDFTFAFLRQAGELAALVAFGGQGLDSQPSHSGLEPSVIPVPCKLKPKPSSGLPWHQARTLSQTYM